jgi:hypothetical protein
MLTIIRVTAQRKEDLPALALIGAEMNQIRPGVFTGLRRRGDGFACEIATSADRLDHERSALDFVTQSSPQLEQARNLGAAVTVDMALDSVDFKKPIEGVHFGAEVLRALGERKISLEVTVYTGLPFGSAPISTSDPDSD